MRFLSLLNVVFSFRRHVGRTKSQAAPRSLLSAVKGAQRGTGGFTSVKGVGRRKTKDERRGVKSEGQKVGDKERGF